MYGLKYGGLFFSNIKGNCILHCFKMQWQLAYYWEKNILITQVQHLELLSYTYSEKKVCGYNYFMSA